MDAVAAFRMGILGAGSCREDPEQILKRTIMNVHGRGAGRPACVRSVLGGVYRGSPACVFRPVWGVRGAFRLGTA